MSFVSRFAGPLEYRVSDRLQGPVVHCFSTRLGGVSQGPLSGLNLGTGRGDRPGNVVKNYRLLGRAVGFSPGELVFARQVHEDTVCQVDGSWRGRGLSYPGSGDYDALITDTPHVALTVFSADCTPILLYDPEHGAIGAVHSGWRGTAKGIVKKAVQAMTRAYGCRPQAMVAAIGPCIGPCCFATREDVPQAMEKALGALALPAICRQAEGYFVDLKLLNRIWLQEAGVGTIDTAPDCTGCDPVRYWSHRKLGQARGSMANVIMLTDEGAERL